MRLEYPDKRFRRLEAIGDNGDPADVIVEGKYWDETVCPIINNVISGYKVMRALGIEPKIDLTIEKLIAGFQGETNQAGDA